MGGENSHSLLIRSQGAEEMIPTFGRKSGVLNSRSKWNGNKVKKRNEYAL